MLNLVQVRTFLAVLDNSGFRGAAAYLKTSQPTVTQHIKKLETEMGLPLIRRGHATCEPTAYGARFVPFARRLISLEEETRLATRTSSFVIGASTNVGTYLLQPIYKSFIDTTAGSEGSSLRLGSNPEIIAGLATADIDVAVTEWWDDRPGFQSQIWRRERLVVIVSPRHPWSGRHRVSRQDLFGTPMIGGEPGSGTAAVLRRAFGDAVREVQVSHSLGSTEAVKQAVRADLGVSIVLESAIHDEVESGALRALQVSDVALEKRIHVAYPNDLPATAAHAAFIDFLMSPGQQ